MRSRHPTGPSTSTHSRRCDMAVTRNIIFTACPNGLGSPGHLRLSVHIAPRLDPGVPVGQLSTFTEWLTWPSQTITWKVFFNTGGGDLGVPATIITAPASDVGR